MRPRTLPSLLLLVLAVLLPVLAACSKDETTTATGPGTPNESTTVAPPGTTDDGTVPPDGGVTAGGSSTTTKGTRVPRTKPAPASTTTKPKATPTTKAPASTKAPTPTTVKGPPAPQQFCDWARSLLIEDKSVSFQQYSQNRYDATMAVGGVMPADLAADYQVIIAASEKLKPAIDSGEVTSALGATQWYAKNDPGLYDQLVTAVQHVGAYRKGHC